MHYYTFNVGDYRKDTGHLSTLEHGIYRQLLDWYYLDEKPIPKETQVVLRRLRLGSDSDISALKNVLQDFFVLQADGYHQTRCDADIAAYHSKAEVNKINGKLGGRPKKTQTVIVGMPDETQEKGNQEPLTINQEPETKNQKPSQPYQALFDVFWGKYPKKVGKDAALKAFQKRKPDQHLLVQMLNAIGEQSRSEAWVKDGGQFIPNPATWLNQGRWQDEISNAMPIRTLNKQEALEASNRAVVDRLLMKEGLL